MTKRAARYLRQSPTQKAEEGIDRQGPRTAALVEARGWIDAGTYVDEDVSASKERGPGTAWWRLLEDAKAGKIDVVVGVDMDRVLRTTRDLNTLIDHGLALVTVDGEIDLSTADGEFRATMLAGIARFEVRRKGERQRRAQLQRAEKGRPPRGIRPTGYTLDGEVIEAEAMLVRRIFDRFTAGGTLIGIARELQEEGVATRRGGRWSASTVSAILQNSRYAGRSVYKGVDIGPGQWEAIIDEAQFQAVQDRLADPTRKTRGPSIERKHLGSGIYFCTCGLRVRSGSGMGDGLTRYSCRHRCYYRSARPVDEYVVKAVRERLSRPDLSELLAEPGDEQLLADLAAERKRIRNRIKATEADYDNDLIDGQRLKAKLERLTDELDAVRNAEARLIAQHGPDSILAAEDPVAAFDAAPLALRRRTIDALAVVTLRRGAGRGRKTFDRESVDIAFRGRLASV